MKPEDYENYSDNLVNAIMTFNGLFSDYVKQMNPDMWQRAVDYAKDYAKSGNVSFNYVKDKIPEHIIASTLSQTIFIKELSDEIEAVRDMYITFVESNSKLLPEEIQQKWLKENETTAEDPFGYEEDFEVFIRCDHKFTFAEFDEDDWMNYTNIVIHCTKDKEFQQAYLSMLYDTLTEKSDVYQYFIRCMEEQDNV